MNTRTHHLLFWDNLFSWYMEEKPMMEKPMMEEPMIDNAFTEPVIERYVSIPPPTILSPERPLPPADELQQLVADLTALVQQLLKK